MEPAVTNNLGTHEAGKFNDVLEFLENNNINCKNISPLFNGRNSQVFYIESTNDKKFIVKKYYFDPTDKRNRAKTEYDFLLYLEKNNINNVARPICLDDKKHMTIISFLPGKMPKSSNQDLINMCGNFIKEINQNRFKKYASRLPFASESQDSIISHIKTIEERLQILYLFSKENENWKYVNSFVEKNLIKTFNSLYRKVQKNFSEELITRNLSKEFKILSPSDFGLRNTLFENENLYFLDFEYAGWDDPAKLACDFTCQPDVPIRTKESNAFINSFMTWYDFFEDLKSRYILLLPFYRLKWCGIMLNEFTSGGEKRRKHAKGQVDLKGQFEKSSNYFKEHLDGLY